MEVETFLTFSTNMVWISKFLGENVAYPLIFNWMYLLLKGHNYFPVHGEHVLAST